MGVMQCFKEIMKTTENRINDALDKPKSFENKDKGNYKLRTKRPQDVQAQVESKWPTKAVKDVVAEEPDSKFWLHPEES